MGHRPGGTALATPWLHDQVSSSDRPAGFTDVAHVEHCSPTRMPHRFPIFIQLSVNIH